MADPDFTLYYFPMSYYSQRALYALYEKGVPFNERLVFIHHGEQHEDWFHRISPRGEVPALQDGEESIVGSDNIIDYVDKRCPQGSHLVPDIGTKFGQDVDRYRKLVEAVKVEVISYGVFLNRSLSPSILPMMAKYFTQEKVDQSQRQMLNGIENVLENTTDPEIREAVKKKLEDKREIVAATHDINQVSKHLDSLEELFDELEAQLTRTKQSCSTADYWLCGNTFTTADLHVTILLLRINLLGLDERYISSKRPHLCEYRDRLMERPPAKKLKQAPQLMKKAFMKRTMTIAAKYALKAGVVVAVVGTGFFIYRKYFRQ